VNQLHQLHSSEDGQFNFEMLSHLEMCPLHEQPITHFDDSSIHPATDSDFQQVIYACESCISEGGGASFAKIDQDNLLNVHQLKEDIIKEQHTCNSYLNKTIRSLNTRCSEIIPQAKLLELSQLHEHFDRMQRLLKSK
jgi:hypothetical protein